MRWSSDVFTNGLGFHCLHASIWGADEPCLGASQLLLQKGTEVLHHLLALFRCLGFFLKSKEKGLVTVSATVSYLPRGCKVLSGVWKWVHTSLCTQRHKIWCLIYLCLNLDNVWNVLLLFIKCITVNSLHMHMLPGPVGTSTEWMWRCHRWI